MPYELIGTIITILVVFWIGLEIGTVVGRAGTLMDITGTDAYLDSVDWLRVQAKSKGIKAWEARGMLHILSEVKEEGIH